MNALNLRIDKIIHLIPKIAFFKGKNDKFIRVIKMMNKNWMNCEMRTKSLTSSKLFVGKFYAFRFMLFALILNEVNEKKRQIKRLLSVHQFYKIRYLTFHFYKEKQSEHSSTSNKIYILFSESQFGMVIIS